MAAFATSYTNDATRTDYCFNDDGEFYTTGEGTSGVVYFIRPLVTITTGTGDTSFSGYYESEPEPPRLNRHLTKKLKKLEKLYSDKKKIKACLLIQTDPYLGFLVPKNLTFFTKKMRCSKIEIRPRANLKAGRRPPMVRYRLQKLYKGEK